MENVYELIAKLEEKYGTGYREYIERVLTALSNNKKTISDCDIQTMCTQMVELDIRETSFMNAIRNVDHAGSFDDMIVHITESTTTKQLFRGTLTYIPTIIEHLIANKDNYKTTGNVSFNNYLVHFMSNLDLLSLYYGEVLIVDDIDHMTVGGHYTPGKGFHSIIEQTDGMYIDLDEEDTLIEAAYDDVFTNDEVSEEVVNKNIIKATRDALKSVLNRVIKIATKISDIKRNTKGFLDKINPKRILFYRKNLGKIEHLFNEYGSESEVVENDMHGDPVEILFSKCEPYLLRVMNGVIKIKKDYDQLMAQLFKVSVYSEMVDLVGRFCEYPDTKLVPDSKPAHIRKAIRTEIRFRVATLILDKNKVYGYTVESIVRKKYPPVNHLMVSLFINNPHEKPITRTVTDIFKSPKSFNIMSDKMKNIVMSISKNIDSKLRGKDITMSYKKYSGNMSRRMSEVKEELKVSGNSVNSGKNKENRKDAKRINAVLMDVVSIYESFVPIYMYVADASNVMYFIALRVDKSCQDSIHAMLKVEAKKTDKLGKYKTGTSVGKGTKAKTSKDQMDEIDRNNKRVVAKKELKSELKKTIKKLNK